MAKTRKNNRGKAKAAAAGAARPRPRAVTAGFDAGSIGRRTDKWLATPAGINSLLQFSLPIMRDRVRDQARNVPWVKRATKSWVANVIGTGIRPIPATPDQKFNAAIAELWSDWIEVCDADGRLDFYGLQTLAARAYKTAGEVLVRKRYRPTDKYDLPVPLQLQMIESDLLDHRLTEKLADGGRIIQGIELDPDNQRIFYHMWKEHPHEMLSGFGGALRVKVPADEIIHIFETDRPGQQRGFPSMISSVIRMLDLAEFEDAALTRQKLAAMLVAFIKSVAPEDGGSVFDQKTDDEDPNGAAVATLESGTMQQLDPGQEVQFTPTVDAGSNLDAFIKWHLRAQAADADITYEQSSGDYHGVTFSSVRASLNEVHRMHEQTQDNIFIHQFCRPTWRDFVIWAVKAGAVDMPKDFVAQKRKYLRAKWIPDGWPYVSPVDESKATLLDLRAGVTSRASQVARRGRDITELDKEISRDNLRADKLGLVFDSDPRQTDIRGQVQPEEPPPPLGDAKDDSGEPAGDKPPQRRDNFGGRQAKGKAKR